MSGEEVKTRLNCLSKRPSPYNSVFSNFSAFCIFEYNREMSEGSYAYRRFEYLPVMSALTVREGSMNKIRGTYWPSGARFLSVVSYTRFRRMNFSANFCISLCSAKTFLSAWLCGQSSRWWIIIRGLLLFLERKRASSYVCVQMSWSPQPLESV